LIREIDLLANFPAEMPVSAAAVATSVASADRVLVVLDDDPTGTQSVSGVPVLTRWDQEDFCWAFRHMVGTRTAPALYVLTNTPTSRSALWLLLHRISERPASGAACSMPWATAVKKGLRASITATSRDHLSASRGGEPAKPPRAR